MLNLLSKSWKTDYPVFYFEFLEVFWMSNISMKNPGKLWYIFIEICLFGKTTMRPLSNYELSNPREYKHLLRIVVMKI